MRRMDFKLLSTCVFTLLLVAPLAAAPALHPATHAPGVAVDFDLSPFFNADAVVNNGSGLDATQDGVDINGRSFPTQSAAAALYPSDPDGLPDNAFFPSNPDHPDVTLGWSNSDNGDNAWRADGAGSINVDVPDDYYGRIDVFATAGDGDAPLQIRINYSDGSFYAGNFMVPDWYSTPAPGMYTLIDDLDRVEAGNSYDDANATAIFGIRMNPDPSKVVTGITLSTTVSGSVLNVFGATGVGTFPAVAATPVPTASEWALIALALGVAVFGLARLRL